MLFVKDRKYLTRLFIFLAVFALGCSAQGEGAGAEETSAQPPASKPAESKSPLYQVGPWGPFTYNIEEPYIDIIHASQTAWSSKNFDMAALWDGGHIGRTTGLPVSLPKGETLTSGVYFTIPRNSGLGSLWDGEWVLDWQTADGDCSADVVTLYLNEKQITKSRPCRIEFTRDAAGGATPYHMAVQVKRLKSPLVSLRMYRAENEELLNAGKIYNPKFLAALEGYDIVRMMDLQEANRMGVRSVDQLATMEAAHWGNIEWQVKNNTAAPFRSMPLEAVFALGVESGAALWVHAPITLGSPVGIFDPSVFDPERGVWLSNYTSAIDAAKEEILADDAWDAYADHFVAALVESGYPADRPLYVTLSNEVWNFAYQYHLTTRYASALGKNPSEGYGRAMARLKLALDAALKRAERDQSLVYVVEGQAANQATTRQALAGLKAFLEAQGQAWEGHAGSLGVSVASYWGAAPNALKSAGVDPNDAAALEDWFLNGAPGVSNLQWNMRQWKAHAAEAAKYGVRLIGAYEGGSHLERKGDFSKENHTAFVWGEPGARINNAVNAALADAFPGVILSNYVLAGAPGSQPWFEGPLGADNPYSRSWEIRAGK